MGKWGEEWVGTHEGLGPEKRGEETVSGRWEGLKDLKVGLHCCLVAHLPWPLLLLAKFSFTPGVPRHKVAIRVVLGPGDTEYSSECPAQAESEEPRSVSAGPPRTRCTRMPAAPHVGVPGPAP